MGEATDGGGAGSTHPLQKVPNEFEIETYFACFDMSTICVEAVTVVWHEVRAIFCKWAWSGRAHVSWSKTVWLCRRLSPVWRLFSRPGTTFMCSRFQSFCLFCSTPEVMKPSALCVSKVFAASALLVTVRGHNAEYTLHFSQPCGLKEKTPKLWFFQIV